MSYYDFFDKSTNYLVIVYWANAIIFGCVFGGCNDILISLGAGFIISIVTTPLTYTLTPILYFFLKAIKKI